MHQRKLIRHAITAALLGATDAKKRVFPTRKVNHLLAELPVIAVYTLNDDSELGDEPRELDRKLEILIECMVESKENVDDLMDDLAEQVEAAMNIDYTFGCLCHRSNLISTDLDSIEDSDREIGIIEMTYLVEYRTDAYVAAIDEVVGSGPDLTDYERSTVAHDLGGNQADADQTNDAFEQE